MGRNRPAAQPTGNALIASGVRMTNEIAKDYVKYSRSGRGWQEMAWGFYRTIGEYRFACDWVGSMLSKAILHATVEGENGPEPTTGDAATYVDELFGDSDGKAEMLRLLGIHFTVAGECWVVGSEDMLGVKEWQVVASTDVTYQTKQGRTVWYVDKVEVPDGAFVHRLWVPDPQKPKEATSPSRAVLTILGEIQKLTQHVAAQVDSRLAGAGVLFVAQELQFPPPADGSTGNTATDVMNTLTLAMETAIADRGSASALSPIVMTVPGEFIGKAAEHLTFWTELDRQAVELRAEGLRRLALGMDMPPEVMEGVADTNHWAAWQADESAIKAHTEPLLKIVTSSLAKAYLRPLLLDDGMAPQEVVHYSIGADTSNMRLRPNRSKEALELYDRGELSGAALRRETGFGIDDKMEPEEIKDWYTRKVASGSTTPELVAQALRALGVDVAVEVPDVEPTEERPTPSLVDHPTRDMPDREQSERRQERRVDAALIAASEQVVIRALERAGNRLKNKFQIRPHGVSAMNLYLHTPVKVGEFDNLLDDAWTNIGSLADRYEISEDWLATHLDSYTRILLGSQEPHTFDRFELYMLTNMMFVQKKVS